MTTGAFLETLEDEERRELEACFEARQFAAGEPLFAQGDAADTAFLIREGQVELTLTLPGEAVVPIALVGAGGLIGEPSLLVPGRRQLGAVARTPTRIEVFDRHDFDGLLHGYRPVSFHVLTEIARLIGMRLQSADAATGGQSRPDPSPNAAIPLGETEHPGCSFDPLPFLPKLPFFAELSLRDQSELITLGRVWELPRGRQVLAAGELSKRCYIVIRGAVEAINPALGRRVALFGPGTMFGQLSPLLGAPVISDCAMRESGAVLELHDEALAELLAPKRRLSYRFMRATAISLLAGLARANRVLARAKLRERHRREESST